MEAQPAGWSRLFTDLTFLPGTGAGGGQSRHSRVGQTDLQETETAMRTSTSPTFKQKYRTTLQ